jgi:hypothetical protein
MVLIENMVFAVIHGKTVRVIHPTDLGGQMVYRPLAIADKCSVFFLILSGFLKDFTDHRKYLDD